MKTLYCICKEETGSNSTTLYKDVMYRYTYCDGLFQIKVYDGLGRYVYFFEDDFKKYFYFTKNDFRKYKLEKIEKL